MTKHEVFYTYSGKPLETQKSDCIMKNPPEYFATSLKACLSGLEMGSYIYRVTFEHIGNVEFAPINQEDVE